MKRIYIVVFLSIIASISYGQTATPKAKVRQGNQKERIGDGVENGDLTKREAHQLKKQQRNINQTKRAAKADGVVTKEEKAVINQKQNRASRNIRRKKNN